MDLRCDSKLHARLFAESGLIEVKCNSRFCGAGQGVVVLHRYDITSGELVETDRFKDPERSEPNAAHSNPAAVRFA